MIGRFGLGPVFHAEWLVSSRRWQGYALRSGIVAAVFAVLVLVCSVSPITRSGTVSRERMAETSVDLYVVMIGVLLGAVGFVAPGATAGSICLDKARGNFDLLFATDLSTAEIVLGKLAARLIPVLGLVGCTIPLLAICLLFGGLQPIELAGAVLVVITCAVFGCVLAMTLSVWGQKTHEVLMGTYLFGIGWLLAPVVLLVFRTLVPGGWLQVVLAPYQTLVLLNPAVQVLQPVDATFRPFGLSGIAQQLFFGTVGLSVSVVLVGFTIWQIRSVVTRQRGYVRKQRGNYRLSRTWAGLYSVFPGIPSPTLDGNPVLWREWHRRRPSRWTIAIWTIYFLFSGGFSLLIVGQLLLRRGFMPGFEMAAVLNAMQAGVGLLLLSVPATTSLSEERQRGSLDVLLATPLPTKTIVLGKWWGAFQMVPAIVILPVLVATVVSFETGAFYGPVLIGLYLLAFGAAITSLGFVIAIWNPKLGRAVGLTVGIFLFITFGFPFLLLLLGGGQDSLILCSASPLFGVGYTTGLLADLGNSDDLYSQCFFLTLVTLGYILAAILLRMDSVNSFDRQLERLSEH